MVKDNRNHSAIRCLHRLISAACEGRIVSHRPGPTLRAATKAPPTGEARSKPNSTWPTGAGSGWAWAGTSASLVSTGLVRAWLGAGIGASTGVDSTAKGG